MDVMDLRRGLMMGVAGAAHFAQGTYEPAEDKDSVELDVGFACKAFFLIATDKTLVSGKRQIFSISWVSNNGYVYQINAVSNATGSSIAAVSSATEDSQPINPTVSVNGNSITVSAANAYIGAKFMGGKTYKWFAYA